MQSVNVNLNESALLELPAVFSLILNSLARIVQAFHIAVLNLCVRCKAALTVTHLLQQHVPHSPVTQHDYSHTILHITEHSKHYHAARNKGAAFRPRSPCLHLTLSMETITVTFMKTFFLQLSKKIPTEPVHDFICRLILIIWVNSGQWYLINPLCVILFLTAVIFMEQ